LNGNHITLITQIYEIQTPEEVESLCALGIDHIGSVILSSDIWQQPLLRETIHAIQQGGKKSSLIPLFSTPDAVFRTLDYYRPDIVHFCDVIPDPLSHQQVCNRLIDLQQEVRKRYPELALMRSIPIGRSSGVSAVPTMKIAELFQPVSDYFLTDTILSSVDLGVHQPVDGFIGITGQTCHWGTARQLVLESEIPVILAGGLSPENVYDAILEVAPAGVDSCTCTNRLDHHGKPQRFKKDLERVERFVLEARRASANLPGEHIENQAPPIHH
jgi:phosphoribosylanthranilate isomerase